MPRQLWGKMKETSVRENETEKMVPVAAKRTKLEEMQEKLPSITNKRYNSLFLFIIIAKILIFSVELQVKNPLVTQTIEVMKQTEMLQSLIDTYSNKSVISYMYTLYYGF